MNGRNPAERFADRTGVLKKRTVNFLIWKSRGIFSSGPDRKTIDNAGNCIFSHKFADDPDQRAVSLVCICKSRNNPFLFPGALTEANCGNQTGSNPGRRRAQVDGPERDRR